MGAEIISRHPKSSPRPHCFLRRPARLWWLIPARVFWGGSPGRGFHWLAMTWPGGGWFPACTRSKGEQCDSDLNRCYSSSSFTRPVNRADSPASWFCQRQRQFMTLTEGSDGAASCLPRTQPLMVVVGEVCDSLGFLTVLLRQRISKFSLDALVLNF